jgi:hypothetical protein
MSLVMRNRDKSPANFVALNQPTLVVNPPSLLTVVDHRTPIEPHLVERAGATALHRFAGFPSAEPAALNAIAMREVRKAQSIVLYWGYTPVTDSSSVAMSHRLWTRSHMPLPNHTGGLRSQAASENRTT